MEGPQVGSRGNGSLWSSRASYGGWRWLGSLHRRSRVMDAGFAVAMGFFGIGLLWLLGVQFLIGAIEWLRKLVG